MSAPAVGEWRISAALARAQLQATLTRLDAGTGNAVVRLYATARSSGVGLGGSPMAEIKLAKPSGQITAEGLLDLKPATADGVMVLQSGVPRWGDLVAADGVVLADGGVTDADHGGCFQVAGGKTAEGDDSPMFYAGGLVTLSGTALG